MSSELATTAVNHVPTLDAEIDWEEGPVSDSLKEKIDWCVEKAVNGSQMCTKGLAGTSGPVVSKWVETIIDSAAPTITKVAQTAVNQSVNSSGYMSQSVTKCW